MGMSDLYGPADDTESIATIHAALDAGITLLDTGDYYGSRESGPRSRARLARCLGPSPGAFRRLGRPARPQ